MEDEIQARLEVAENNANLLLKPKFIPVYTELNGKWLSLMEKTLYWFIEFFLSNNEKFYCTNKQLTELFECSESRINDAIKCLENKWYIEIHRQMKTWWWLVRFITLTDTENQNLQTVKNTVRELWNSKGIYNKNNIDNNIYKENEIAVASIKQEMAEDNLWENTEVEFDDVWNNYYCIPVRKWDRKEAEKEFNNLKNKEWILFEENILKYEYKYKILDIKYCKKCSNWLKNYSPQDEELQKDRLLEILKIHKQQKDISDDKEKQKLKKNYEEMKKDFGEEFIKDLYKQAKVWKITIKTF